MNGSGAGAESLAAEFRAGDGLEGYLGRWLLLQVAGGDVEAMPRWPLPPRPPRQRRPLLRKPPPHTTAAKTATAANERRGLDERTPSKSPTC